MSRKEKSEDLKNMLTSFRIAELQTLLSACGRSRSGRKHELLGRAMSLLKSSEGSPMRDRVKTKILELYHQRCAPGISPSSFVGSSSLVLPQKSHNDSYNSYVSYENDRESAYLNRPTYIKSQSRTTLPYHPLSHEQSRSMQSLYDGAPNIHPSNSVPIHPDVRFIKLPFYDIVDELIKPTSLVQKTITGYQGIDLVYHLSPLQTQTIQKSSIRNIKSVVEYTVQVHLRFCLAETSCVQEDLYPPKCKIVVNGRGVTLPGQPPPNAQNQEPRKPHRPINITSFCKLSPMVSNQIQVQWMPSELGQRYAATVHMVKVVQTETLINKLRNKPERSPEHTVAFIKEKLRQDPDSEIALTSLKVSLSCPIGMTRMKIPCRANNCNHLQCFDGSLYIQMNERKPSWVCPVCDQKAHYDQLFKDGLFLQILQKNPESEDIVFFGDGSWRTLSDMQDPAKLSQVLNTPAPQKPSTVLDCKTPPPLTPVTPPAPIRPPVEPTSPKLLMPQLERATTITSNRTPSPADDSQQEKEDIEVICIDDSDSEDAVPPPPPPNAAPSHSHGNANEAPRWSSHPTIPTSSSASSSSLPFNDPDLQGLDLYNILPREDRIAAALYLEQVGILGQLTNATGGGAQQSNIIDISDE